AGCTAPAADRGGIAFQPGAGGVLAPDELATAQATPALAQVALPVTSATIDAALPAPCASATTTTPTTTIAVLGSPQPTTSTTGMTNVAAAEAQHVLPRTGSDTTPAALVAVCALVAGGACLAGTRRRRA
ncbi:MAG TPA: LPXTG cell wall anchor domain-containing protein, partial [Acidimicrobiia bacterium]|nr:LPXTG cell wall anchor domain-containing protein [Acidimicrobiia bacterium]